VRSRTGSSAQGHNSKQQRTRGPTLLWMCDEGQWEAGQHQDRIIKEPHLTIMHNHRVQHMRMCSAAQLSAGQHEHKALCAHIST
jgi:hypothetical protein